MYANKLSKESKLGHPKPSPLSDYWVELFSSVRCCAITHCQWANGVLPQISALGFISVCLLTVPVHTTNMTDEPFVALQEYFLIVLLQIFAFHNNNFRVIPINSQAAVCGTSCFRVYLA